MKNIGFILAAVCAFAATAKATDYTVSASTYPINETSTMAAQISGEQEIDKLTVSNSTMTMQTVYVYSNCGSTQTVTSVMTLVIPANVPPVMLDYTGNYNNPLIITDACFRKSDVSASVYVNAHYR